MKKSHFLFLSLLSTTSLLQAMENEIREIKPHVQPKLNKPFMSGQSQFGDYKTLPIDYVGTYNERSNLGVVKLL